MDSNYYHEVNYSVCRTGKLEQYYTLYRSATSGLKGVWARSSCFYLGNLSHELDKAMVKAESKAGNCATIEYYETPRKEYDEFTAFDLKWKNGKNCYYAYPSQDFFTIWRDNKDLLKQMGFWVSKTKTGEFMVFCKLDETKDFASLPTLKDDYPTIENGRQLLTGKLISVKFTVNQWDDSGSGYYRATFELESGYKVNGTLPKAIDSEGNINKMFSFNGTVEDQGKGFGFYKRPAKVNQVN